MKVARAAELSAGAGKLIEVAGRQIALFQVEGRYFALDNECTHSGGPLSEGMIQGAEVECPWHSGRFNLETGQATQAPPLRPVACYPVRRQGDDIEVEI